MGYSQIAGWRRFTRRSATDSMASVHGNIRKSHSVAISRERRQNTRWRHFTGGLADHSKEHFTRRSPSRRIAPFHGKIARSQDGAVSREDRQTTGWRPFTGRSADYRMALFHGNTCKLHNLAISPEDRKITRARHLIGSADHIKEHFSRKSPSRRMRLFLKKKFHCNIGKLQHEIGRSQHGTISRVAKVSRGMFFIVSMFFIFIL